MRGDYARITGELRGARTDARISARRMPENSPDDARTGPNRGEAGPFYRERAGAFLLKLPEAPAFAGDTGRGERRLVRPERRRA